MNAEPVPTPSQRFSYRFAWNRAEFRRANRLVWRNAIYPTWLKLFLKVTPWFAGTVLILWLAFVAIQLDWNALARSAPWLILILGWFAFLRYGAPWLAIRAWEKRHPPGHREIGITLDGGGFVTTSHPGELRLIWDAVPQIVETDEFFLFYIANQLAHYLPKVVIPPEDLSPLRRLLAAAKHGAFRPATTTAKSAG